MKSKWLKVAEMLDLQGVEGVWCLACKPRKISQNIVSQWYKVVSLRGKHLKCNEW